MARAKRGKEKAKERTKEREKMETRQVGPSAQFCGFRFPGIQTKYNYEDLFLTGTFGALLLLTPRQVQHVDVVPVAVASCLWWRRRRWWWWCWGQQVKEQG